jgi:hypothetical protein
MSRLVRFFLEALDRVDYAVTLSRCWAVDLIYGPEPPTPADRERDAEHERLRKAFPVIDLDGRIAVDEERHERAQSMPNHLLTASGEAPPPPAPSAHQSAP